MTGSWRWSLVAVAGVGLVLASLPLVLYWPQLPDPMAVHWSLDLRPDGVMSKRGIVLVDAALIGGSLLLGLIGAVTASARGRAMRLMIVTLLSGLAATTTAMIVARNVHKSSWSDAESLTVSQLLLMIGVPLAAAAGAYLLASRVWTDVRTAAPASAPGLALAAEARVFWTGDASNRWLLIIGGALLVQAAALPLALPRIRALPVLLAVHVLVFVTLELFSRIRVTIDGRGIAVRYGHLALWTRRLPLERIVAARAITLDALEHGGWGYRGGLLVFGKASIVVRSGPALRLDLSGGKKLFITVDDASTAAQLLNGLLERKQPPNIDAAVPAERSTTRA